MTEAPEPVVARGLVKRYGELMAVDHVDLTVERGDVFGYLGPNGAGKTTSLRMLLGLIRPTAGSIQVGGQDLARLRSWELAYFRQRTVGMIFQSFNLIAWM